MGDVPLRWRKEERSKCNVSLPLSVIDILLPPALNVPWRDDDCNNNSYVRASTSRSPSFDVAMRIANDMPVWICIPLV